MYGHPSREGGFCNQMPKLSEVSAIEKLPSRDGIFLDFATAPTCIPHSYQAQCFLAGCRANGLDFPSEDILTSSGSGLHRKHLSPARPHTFVYALRYARPASSLSSPSLPSFLFSPSLLLPAPLLGAVSSSFSRPFVVIRPLCGLLHPRQLNLWG